ncbi:hypothetical protein K474DRAFT_1689688 [Panus rudis PR-1116 ss-1]|nr:hypothetical protein K474DRAFT_1689688 [Panus rudis PR-1116 ss-1]
MSFSRSQALRIFTTSPWTRDLRHTTAVIPRFWTQRTTWKDGRVKSVKPKDRIKWWNIVPGDRVRLLGDTDGTIYEVHQINKLTNRVLIKTGTDSEDAQTPNARTNRQVPYSRCQLFIGNHQFPPLSGEAEPRTLPVFATRLGTTKPHWLPINHRYHWERFATNTIPRLPGWSKDSPERVPIPWPKPAPRTLPAPTAYDTPADAVLTITYTPPALPKYPRALMPSPPSEHEYIKSLSEGSKTTFDSSRPMEVHVQKELSNPHSRAKKQARWQAYQLYKRNLLRQMVQAEYNNLHGRTRREARAEATWKWREKLAEERKAEEKRRWRNRGQEAKLAGRKQRKARKAERLDRKLRGLVLDAAPNQVVPGSQPSL